MRYSLISVIKLTFICILIFGYTKSFAATSNGNLSVSATVANACTVDNATLSFGSYTLTEKDASTTLNVQCTTGVAYNILMNSGMGTGATTTSRKMTNGANTLNYTLYRDGARTNIWGLSIGVDTIAGVGTGNVQTIDIFGRIPAGQGVPTGTYNDTVTITVDY